MPNRDPPMCRLPLLVLFLLCVGGAVDAKPASLDKLTINYHRDRRTTRPIPGHDGHHAYLADSVSVKGKRWVGLVRVSSPQHGSICFPPLRQGEIVPLFGSLYRVESTAVEVVRLKPDAAQKGVAVAKDSFVVPLMSDETGSGQIVVRTARDEYIPKTVFVHGDPPRQRWPGRPRHHRRHPQGGQAPPPRRRVETRRDRVGRAGRCAGRQRDPGARVGGTGADQAEGGRRQIVRRFAQIRACPSGDLSGRHAVRRDGGRPAGSTGTRGQPVAAVAGGEGSTHLQERAGP